MIVRFRRDSDKLIDCEDCPKGSELLAVINVTFRNKRQAHLCVMCFHRMRRIMNNIAEGLDLQDEGEGE